MRKPFTYTCTSSSISKVSRFWLACVGAQARYSSALSETLKAGFLMNGLKSFKIIISEGMLNCFT